MRRSPSRLSSLSPVRSGSSLSLLAPRSETHRWMRWFVDVHRAQDDVIEGNGRFQIEQGVVKRGPDVRLAGQADRGLPKQLIVVHQIVADLLDLNILDRVGDGDLEGLAELIEQASVGLFVGIALVAQRDEARPEGRAVEQQDIGIRGHPGALEIAGGVYLLDIGEEQDSLQLFVEIGLRPGARPVGLVEQEQQAVRLAGDALLRDAEDQVDAGVVFQPKEDDLVEGHQRLEVGAGLRERPTDVEITRHPPVNLFEYLVVIDRHWELQSPCYPLDNSLFMPKRGQISRSPFGSRYRAKSCGRRSRKSRLCQWSTLNLA